MGTKEESTMAPFIIITTDPFGEFRFLYQQLTLWGVEGLVPRGEMLSQGASVFFCAKERSHHPGMGRTTDETLSRLYR